MEEESIKERIKIEVLRNQIELLDRFYRVIGDGYNPASINLTSNGSARITEEDIFIYKSANHIGSEKYYLEQIKPTKEEVKDLYPKLQELMTWNKNHVLSFDACKKIIREEYRLKEFDEIYDNTLSKVQDITNKWNTECYSYLIDTKDASYKKYVFIHDDSKSLVFEFGNFIH